MTHLRGFVAHGVIFSRNSGNQAIGDCPFCQKEGHFYANVETRQWDCKRCGAAGGWRTFLTEISKGYVDAMTPKLYERIAITRELPVSAFQGIELGWDGDCFTLPVRDEKDGVADIRRWRAPKGALLSTPTAKLSMWNGQALADPDRKKERIYVCEGEWDAIAMRWLLSKIGEPGIAVGMPGATTFKKEWVPRFEGREVYTIYDHDEPGETGDLVALERLSGTAQKIHWLHWPESLPLKFDLRDYIKLEAVQKGKPRAAFKKLLLLFKDYPRRSTKGNVEVEVQKPPVQPIEGKASRKVVLEGYRKWLHLNSNDVLDVMFGAVLANRLEGDPIWLFLVAPPGGSKTELLMSLSKADHIETTTSLTPHALVSGAVWSSGTDPSLIPKLDGKVLVIKDFTTILKMHFTARDEIFGILRDAYDGKTEKVFGTGIKRSYESRFGVLAGVTPAIDSFSVLHASLGERFLKFRIDDSLRHTNEEETIRRALSNINREVGMREQIADTAAHCLAREIPKKTPTINNATLDRIIALARVTAWLRGVVEREKFTGSVLYRPTAEIGTRLAKQLAKVGMGIAIFQEKGTIDEQAYPLICKVARDTCPDRIDELVRVLWQDGKQGSSPMSTLQISVKANLPTATVFRILADFELLCIVKKLGTTAKAEWILTNALCKLIEQAQMYPN